MARSALDVIEQAQRLHLGEHLLRGLQGRGLQRQVADRRGHVDVLHVRQRTLVGHAEVRIAGLLRLQRIQAAANGNLCAAYAIERLVERLQLAIQGVVQHGGGAATLQRIDHVVQRAENVLRILRAVGFDADRIARARRAGKRDGRTVDVDRVAIVVRAGNRIAAGIVDWVAAGVGHRIGTIGAEIDGVVDRPGGAGRMERVGIADRVAADDQRARIAGTGAGDERAVAGGQIDENGAAGIATGDL